MKITTKKNAAGEISDYYVDGIKTRKNQIDGILDTAARNGEIIEVDYYTGQEFCTLLRSPYSDLKVVFTNSPGGLNLMTEAAAIVLGAKIGNRFTGRYSSLKVHRVEFPTVVHVEEPITAIVPAEFYAKHEIKIAPAVVEGAKTMTTADTIPQEYLDEVMEQIEAIQPVKSIFYTYDPKNIWDRAHLASIAHEFAFYHPREGQPDAPADAIGVWFQEYLKREDEIRAHFAKKKSTAKTKEAPITVIEKKIAKNGAAIYYVNGKRTNRTNAEFANHKAAQKVLRDFVLDVQDTLGIVNDGDYQSDFGLKVEAYVSGNDRYTLLYRDYGYITLHYTDINDAVKMATALQAAINVAGIELSNCNVNRCVDWKNNEWVQYLYTKKSGGIVFTYEYHALTAYKPQCVWNDPHKYGAPGGKHARLGYDAFDDNHVARAEQTIIACLDEYTVTPDAQETAVAAEFDAKEAAYHAREAVNAKIATARDTFATLAENSPLIVNSFADAWDIVQQFAFFAPFEFTVENNNHDIRDAVTRERRPIVTRSFNCPEIHNPFSFKELFTEDDGSFYGIEIQCGFGIGSTELKIFVQPAPVIESAAEPIVDSADTANDAIDDCAVTPDALDVAVAAEFANAASQSQSEPPIVTEPVDDFPSVDTPPLSYNMRRAANIVKLLDGYDIQFRLADFSKGTTCNGKPLYPGLMLYYNDDPTGDKCLDDVACVFEFFTDDDSYILERVDVCLPGKPKASFFFDEPAPVSGIELKANVVARKRECAVACTQYREKYEALSEVERVIYNPIYRNYLERVFGDKPPLKYSEFVKAARKLANAKACLHEALKAFHNYKDALGDSLNRAMTFAFDRYKDFCRVKNLTAANRELQLYDICRLGLRELAG